MRLSVLIEWLRMRCDQNIQSLVFRVSFNTEIIRTAVISVQNGKNSNSNKMNYNFNPSVLPSVHIFDCRRRRTSARAHGECEK